MTKNIIIPNEKKLERIKSNISKTAVKKMHVIADFDRTLTKAFINGNSVPSIISVLRNGNYLTSDYSQKAHALFEKYHPIEINPDIPLEEKRGAMYEWWTNHFDLLIKCKLNKKDMEDVINSENIKLREGALEFLDFLHNHNIPLVIMSATGLGGDSISMLLKKENRFYNNIHIISNSYKWDKDGYAIDIKKPIIHSMNKDETAIQNYPVFEIIKNRKNVLLLGDNIEDVGMIKGFDYDNLIKIGFLNKKIEENLEKYKSKFDIIILNDSNMFYINELLKELI